MHPVLEPEAEIENPYKYTEGTAKVKAQYDHDDSSFAEP